MICCEDQSWRYFRLEQISCCCRSWTSFQNPCTLKNLCLSKFVKLATWLGEICCRERFMEYWVDQNMLTADTATRIFTVLKQPDKNYLTQVSFIHFTKKCYKLWDDDKTLSTVNHSRLWSCLRTYYDNLQRLHPLCLFIPAWLYWQPLACHLMELMCICAIASICCSDHSSSSVFWVLLSWSYIHLVLALRILSFQILESFLEKLWHSTAIECGESCCWCMCRKILGPY